MDLRMRILEALPDATVLARAPGRVNLVGEHTDYNGFPVLPLAIDRHVWVATAPRPDPVLLLRSVEPGTYPPETVPLAALAERPRRGRWSDYVVAAARRRPPASGLEMVVGGDIPPEAGLSSSSALVVAAFLALEEPADRAALAEESRLAERYVGTLSGGMDQAISLLARRGHALYIEFRPLRVEPVRMPADLAVLVADSGIKAAKSGAAREAYNARVRECAEAARRLGASEGGLLADVPGANRARRAAALDDPVLSRRARFVFEEAERVRAARRALQGGDLESLGALLRASHAGLRDDYEVSHPVVDELVREAEAAGALGARVVGAGFGGCIVAVCRRAAAEGVLGALGADAWRFEAAGPAQRRQLDC